MHCSDLYDQLREIRERLGYWVGSEVPVETYREDISALLDAIAARDAEIERLRGIVNIAEKHVEHSMECKRRHWRDATEGLNPVCICDVAKVKEASHPGVGSVYPYKSNARAALRAVLEDMKSPSEGMCAAGLRALSDNGVDASTEGASDADNPHNDALVCWQAMLDQYEKENLGE